jgi:hypothetical protein
VKPNLRVVLVVNPVYLVLNGLIGRAVVLVKHITSNAWFVHKVSNLLVGEVSHGGKKPP